jgi:hypothetical protein
VGVVCAGGQAEGVRGEEMGPLDAWGQLTEAGAEEEEPTGQPEVTSTWEKGGVLDTMEEGVASGII